MFKINQKGFNLLTMSVIVMALGVTMSVTLSFYKSDNLLKRTKGTLDKFKIIELAIKDFAEVNKRIPCPASLECDSTSCISDNHTLGIETSVDIINNTGCTLSGVYDYENVYYGTIPTTSLGLSNDFMVDDFGDKIVYVVNSKLIKHDEFSSFSSDTINNKNTNKDYYIDEKNNVENFKERTMYALISFPKNSTGIFSYNSKYPNSFTQPQIRDIILDDIKGNKKIPLILKETYPKFDLLGFSTTQPNCTTTVAIQKELSTTFNFKGNAKYGEIRFADELCPSFIEKPVTDKNYYYLSNAVDENGKLIDNKPAIRCGKNGQWEKNSNGEIKFIYKCETTNYKCSIKPETSKFNYNWNSETFEKPNTAIIKSNEDEEAQKKVMCYAEYNKIEKMYEANYYNADYNAENNFCSTLNDKFAIFLIKNNGKLVDEDIAKIKEQKKHLVDYSGNIRCKSDESKKINVSCSTNDWIFDEICK